MESQEPDKSGYINTSQKSKKIGFIKRCLMRLLKNDIEKEYASKAHYTDPRVISPRRALSTSHTLESSPMHLKIYPATGGIVIEVSTYDKHAIHDSTTSQLHVIQDGADMGKSIAKIITLEKLRG